jgi:type IV secretion system protein VirB10
MMEKNEVKDPLTPQTDEDLEEVYFGAQPEDKERSDAPVVEQPHKFVSLNRSPKINKQVFMIAGIVLACFTIIAITIGNTMKKEEVTEEGGATGNKKVPFMQVKKRDKQTDPAESLGSAAGQGMTSREQPSGVQTDPVGQQRMQQQGTYQSTEQYQSYQGQSSSGYYQSSQTMSEEDVAKKSGLLKPFVMSGPSGNGNGTALPSQLGQTGQQYGTMGPGGQTTQGLLNYGNSLLNGMPGQNQNGFQTLNMQDEKNRYYNANAGNASVRGYADAYTIITGTMIPAVLVSGINTDLPGDIMAIVDQNVYDSITGQNLLIPQGTKLIAKYNSNVSYAQSRVQIAWTKMIRPDGLIIDLGNMPGVDSRGYSGVGGFVDEHFFQYLKALGVISLFSVIQSELNNATGQAANPAMQDLISANAQATITWGQEIVNRTMDIQPTIIILPGKKVNVFFNTEMRLPAVPTPPVVERYERD